MFGEKARLLADQDQKILALESALKAAEDNPYLSLAVQIQQEVDGRAASIVAHDGSVNVAALVDAVIKGETEQKFLEWLNQALAAVPVLDLLRAYAERVNDPTVNALLARRAVAETQRLQAVEHLLDMREEAMRTRRVDLSKLPVGSIVTIGLFASDIDDNDRVSYANRDNAARTFVCRVDDAERPHNLTILEDTTNAKFYCTDELASPKYSKLAQIEFGKEEYPTNTGLDYYNSSLRYVDPYLDYRVPPAINRDRTGNISELFRHDVGYVKVDDVVVLDNPDHMKSEYAGGLQ